MRLHRASSLLLASLLAGGGVFLACVGDSPTTGPDSGVVDGAADVPITPSDGGGDAPLNCTAPTVQCGAVCADLSKDGINCGKCGRSCLGGACTNGKCASVLVASGLSRPYILKSSTTPDVLVVASEDQVKDGGAPNGGVFRVPKPSGTPTRMWTSVATAVLPTSDLVVVGTNAAFLYSTSGNSYLGTVDLNQNPTSTPLQVPIGSIQGTAVGALDTDAGRYYAHGHNYGTNVKLGSNNFVAVTNQGGTELVFAPSDPYIILTDQFTYELKRCPRAAAPCSTPFVLYKAPGADLGVAHLQVVGSTVYWAVNPQNGTSSILACTLPGPCPTPKVIAKNEAVIRGLAVDATGAYWTDSIGGRIRACQDLTNGCDNASTTLVEGQANAWGITVDANAVYWTINAAAGFIRRSGK